MGGLGSLLGLMVVASAAGWSGSPPLGSGLWLSRAAGMTGPHGFFLTLPCRVLVQEAGFQDTVSMSQASVGRIFLPHLLAKSRHRASPDSSSENEPHLFFFFLNNKWNLLKEIRVLHVNHLFLEDRPAYPFLEVIDTFEILMKAIGPIPRKTAVTTPTPL